MSACPVASQTCTRSEPGSSSPLGLRQHRDHRLDGRSIDRPHEPHPSSARKLNLNGPGGPPGPEAIWLAHRPPWRIFGDMGSTYPKPILKLRQVSRTEWCVEVEWEDGTIESVASFDTDREARDWIAHSSAAWLDERGGLPRIDYADELRGRAFDVLDRPGVGLLFGRPLGHGEDQCSRNCRLRHRSDGDWRKRSARVVWRGMGD
jgi:hypothetical protein